MGSGSVDRYVDAPEVLSETPGFFSRRMINGILRLVDHINGWKGYSNIIDNDEFRGFRKFIPQRSFKIRLEESKSMPGCDCAGFLRRFSIYWNRTDLKPIVNAVHDDPLLGRYFTYNELTDIITATDGNDDERLARIRSRDDSLLFQTRIDKVQNIYETKIVQFINRPVGSGWYLASDRPVHESSPGLIKPIMPGERGYNFSVIGIPSLIVAIKSFYK
ncbi:MAG: hypothetical protein V1866_03485 [archaeon]